MSRHMITKVVRSEVNEDGKQPEISIQYAYGYNKPLQEYFLTMQKISMYTWPDGHTKVTTILTGEPWELVGSLSDVYGSGANLLDMAKRLDLKLPEAHAGQAAMDVPITGDGWTTIETLNGEDE